MKNYTLEVCVKSKPCTEYTHEGDIWIEGRAGTEYEIRLRNNSGTRAKFVVSVDGLSIHDGKVAGIDSRGYILDAKESLIIPGWLVDNNTAAKFKFGTKQNSYAESQGEPLNIGVIGLMVFPEKYNAYIIHRAPDYTAPTPPYQPYRYWTNNNFDPMHATRSVCLNNVQTGSSYAGSAATATAMDQSLGTEFGQSTSFNTKQIEFEQASKTPTYTYIVYYDDSKGLNKLGIVLDWQKQPKARPNPFPADPNFCKKPIGWD